MNTIAHIQASNAAPSGSAARKEHELPVTEGGAGPIAGITARELQRRRLDGDPDRPAHIQIGRRIFYMPSELVRWRDSHTVHPTAEHEQPSAVINAA